jgi:hypothetical protein
VGVFIIVHTSEVGDKVVAREACGPVAGVAVEEGEDGAEGQGRVDAALVLEDLVGLHERGGEVPGGAAHEVAPPE